MVARASALADAFSASWRAFGAPTRLLLAVSGGSDSIALLHLASMLRTRGAALRVATVDHRLRQGSADDARFAEREAASLGVEAIILRWRGDKPATGVQAAARAARYRLLAQEAERWGANAILTAHTADDQAETVLMRMAHRSGVRGLSGMGAETFIADGAYPPQRLLRPLLSLRRAALRGYLTDNGAAFIDDPSNNDTRFERVRVRQAITRSAHGAEATEALIALAGDARRLTALLDRRDKARLDLLRTRFSADGSVSLVADAVSPSADGGLAARLLGAVGGGEPPADGAASNAVGAALAGRQTTLAGALIRREGSKLLVAREPAAVLGRKGEAAKAPVTLAPGARLLWDKRFIVENRLGAAAEVRPVGAAARSLGADGADLLAAAPGLWIGSRLAAFPGDDGPGEAAFRALTAERFYRLVVRH